MEPVSEERFEELVADALDALPDDILDLLDNVVVLIEDRHEEEDLLGLYEGVPQTERDDYGGLALPDRIILYRLPLCEEASDAEELVEEVMITVVHEIAHHFGIDDDRLHQLGWG
jgi:predicted Zn-dependent protease with MMP-like domain